MYINIRACVLLPPDVTSQPSGYDISARENAYNRTWLSLLSQTMHELTHSLMYSRTHSPTFLFSAIEPTLSSSSFQDELVVLFVSFFFFDFSFFFSPLFLVLRPLSFFERVNSRRGCKNIVTFFLFFLFFSFAFYPSVFFFLILNLNVALVFKYWME